MTNTELSGPAVAGGQTRRRLRTRSALLGAARELLAEGREDASIKEITARAGVGFGSFFNHFPGGKDELWFAAVMEVLDEYARWLATATADVDDPAERFARSFRLTGRLALSNPDLLAPVLARGTELLFLEGGVRTAAIADITSGVESGRFVPLDPEVHLVVVGGALLGLVRMLATEPGKASPELVDEVAASALRMLGLDGATAEELCGHPLPDGLSWGGDGDATPPGAARAAGEEEES
ncbi:MAG TPA: TetR/AcrR family transcriptional regulator [Candidatus Dietzia intestinigallinarum]|nr:TetR/AcrR family transcriptional regulator [Candidatus Dietzia intestinigallinarum]